MKQIFIEKKNISFIYNALFASFWNVANEILKLTAKSGWESQ